MNNSLREALLESGQKPKQCFFLLGSSGVGWSAIVPETTTIRNADGVLVVLQTMSACLLDGTAFKYISGLIHDVVLADGFPTTLFVPTGDVGYCDALVGKSSRTMNDDFKNLSHFRK